MVDPTKAGVTQRKVEANSIPQASAPRPQRAPQISEAASGRPSQDALDASNDGSKFRSLVIFNKTVSAADGYVYTADALAEVLARPDRVQATLLFTNVQPGSQMALSFATSFDGVRYSTYSSIAPIPISSGMMFRVNSVGLPVPNARFQGALIITSGSADVRVWATSLMRGHRRFGVTAINRVLNGTGAYYSESAFNDTLGKVDFLQLLISIDQVTGSGVTLTVDLEESPDGIEWATLTTLVNAIGVVGNQSFTLESLGTIPASQLIRLRVALGGSSPSANVRIDVVGRGR